MVQSSDSAISFKSGAWYLHTTVDRSPAPFKTNAQAGMMGIDLNPKEVGWAIADQDGNLVRSGSIRYDLTDKTSNQSEQILALVVKELVEISLHYQVPITALEVRFYREETQPQRTGQSLQQNALRVCI